MLRNDGFCYKRLIIILVEKVEWVQPLALVYPILECLFVIDIAIECDRVGKDLSTQGTNEIVEVELDLCPGTLHSIFVYQLSFFDRFSF